MKVNNNESPANFGFGGNIGSMIQAAANRAPGQSQAAAMLGGSLSGQAKALFNASQQIDPAPQVTNVPPAQANTCGAAQPVFNPQAQQAAQGIYGDVEQRQNAVGATPMFKKCNKKY